MNCQNGEFTKFFQLSKIFRITVLYEIFFCLWCPPISKSFCFEALEGTKISSCKPASSRKYENGYRTEFCDFTVVKPVFLRPREIRVLSQEDKLAVLNCLFSRKARNKSFVSVRSERSLASAVLVHVHGGHRKGFIDFFPPAFVNSQIAQVDRPKILERVIFSSSSLCGGVFVTSLNFSFKNWGLRKL